MKKTLLLILFCFSLSASAQLIPDAFVTVRRTTMANETVIVRTNTFLTYNYTVDWGDGTPVSSHTTAASHTYLAPGDYDVSISGSYPFHSNVSNRGNIIEIKQWGNIQWQQSLAFFGEINLTSITATDAPDLSQVVSLAYLFENTPLANPNLNNWDTSTITDMRALFFSSTFNGMIDQWDTSSVTRMDDMFNGNTAFNRDISNWDTSNVTSMFQMFNNASAFNQPVNTWNTSSVVGNGFSGLFYGASSFNQPLSNWDVSNAVDMTGMFGFASSFNQDLNNWDVSNVTSLAAIFDRCFNYNQPLNNWDTSSVTNMRSAFKSTMFNQDISNWNTSQVTNMNSMFSSSDFNQNISSWDTGNVTDMSGMFNRAEDFNQNISSWNTSNVTNMNQLFYNAESFNQDISSWNVEQVTNINQFLGSFTTVTMSFSTENYSRILDQWSQQNVQPNLTFYVDAQYCTAAQPDRDVLTGAPNNWTITDLGVDATATCTLSTDDHEISNLSVLYNPMSNQLTVVESDGIEFIRLFNLSGQLLATTKEVYMDLSTVSNGLYIIHVNQSNGQTQAAKFVKN